MPQIASQDNDTNEATDVVNDLSLEYRQTPLNACTIETCCFDRLLRPAVGCRDHENVAVYLPLCLGCYQLDESTGKRRGRLDLFAVPVKYSANNGKIDDVCAVVNTFGECINILGGEGQSDGKAEASGILDGKWCPLSPKPSQQMPFRNYFASAHASGEILIHRIAEQASTGQNVGQNPFSATAVGKSKPTCEDENSPSALCLALAWDQTSSHETPRIISSYSNGHAAVHRIRHATCDSDDSLEIALEHDWSAHKMFTAPAEVWCCAFVGDNDDGDTNIVATGGDEGSWKLWDLRTSLAKPVHHCPDDFDAGVTVISPHPRQSHLLVVGSYDETIALYDARYQSLSQQQPKSIFHSSSLGGGIWRCKWHPHDHNRLLVAAMHGGCRVVTFDGLISGTDEDTDTAESPPIIMTVDQAFTEHKSMAYGADWLVYGSSEKTRTEVAASCSFYDQAMYLWETPSKHQQ